MKKKNKNKTQTVALNTEKGKKLWKGWGEGWFPFLSVNSKSRFSRQAIYVKENYDSFIIIIKTGR